MFQILHPIVSTVASESGLDMRIIPNLQAPCKIPCLILFLVECTFLHIKCMVMVNKKSLCDMLSSTVRHYLFNYRRLPIIR